MVPKLPSKKILITGATGFVGANLLHCLVNSGYRPHVILRKTSNTWRIQGILKKITVHIADLENKIAIDRLIKKVKPEIIYHCATYGGYYFQNDPDKIVSANIIGTVNLLRSCSEIGFKCFVNTGSSSEYGIKNHSMREDDLLEPINAYGATKSAATLFCQQFAKSKNLPVVTLRLFSPYGYFEDEKRLVASVILSCIDKRAPKLSSAHSVRDFIFVEDVIRAYLKVPLYIKRLSADVINIGSGKQHTTKQIVDQIIKLSGLKLKPVWGAISNPRIEPLLWQADISKAATKLNWEPKFSLISGLSKTIIWFNKHKLIYHGKN